MRCSASQIIVGHGERLHVQCGEPDVCGGERPRICDRSSERPPQYCEQARRQAKGAKAGNGSRSSREEGPSFPRLGSTASKRVFPHPYLTQVQKTSL